jgi:hypothetical protein
MVSRRGVLRALLFLAVLAASTRVDATAARPSLCRLHHPSDERLAWTCHRLRPGESLERLFGSGWVDVARFNRIDRRHAVTGVDLKVPATLEDLLDFTPMPALYPDAEGEPTFLFIDLAEQFLGAYDRGRLVLSCPVTVGEEGHETPTGEFRISAADRWHTSSLYTIQHTSIAYPMTWALRFHTSPAGVTYWLHGRDVPGYPASHGCIGLYDERMQARYYGVPREPVLDDARRLYEWVLGPRAPEERVAVLAGPRVRIAGRAPRPSS